MAFAGPAFFSASSMAAYTALAVCTPESLGLRRTEK